MPSSRMFRPVNLARALGSLLTLVALLAGPPLLLLAVGQLPDGPPGLGDLQHTRLEDVLPTLLTVACWVLWGWWVWCVGAEAVLAARRGPGRRRPVRRAGPRGLAATLLGGILLLPAAQAGAASPAAAVPISDVAAPGQEEGGQEASASRAAQGHPSHMAGAGHDTVWDISERYFPGQERYAEIRQLNAELGNPLPETVALPAGLVVYLPHDAVDQAAAQEAPAADGVVGEEPLLTVTDPGRTVDDVAREHLGDSARAGDIAALNPGLEVDQASDGTLRLGTVLAMPADYAPAAEEAGAGAAGEVERAAEERAEPGTVEETVVAGDTLWALSQQHLGDPTRFGEIYEANRQVIGDDPGLIRPGQELVIHDSQLAPADTDQAPDRPEAEEEEEAPAEVDVPAPEEPPQAGGQPGPGDAETPAPDQPAQGDEPEETQRPVGGGEEANGNAGAAHVVDADTSSVPASVLALGAAGVLAAGVLGLLGHRRMLQQRRRRAGRRIPKPQDHAATTEQALRYVEVGEQVAFLRRALQSAAVSLAAAGRDLPAVAAVALTPRGATLHLAEPSEPAAPFTADEGESAAAARRWRVLAGSKQVLAEEQLGDVEMPYPALVAIGHDLDGALVLVDLEQVGGVRLVGGRRRQMLRTVAAELAVSELGDAPELARVGTLVAPGLEQLGVPERITQYESVEEAVPVLRAQYRDQQAAMTAVGADHLRQARLRDGLDGAWDPLIILADGVFTADADADEALAGLLTMVTTGPRAAAAVVTSSGPVDVDEEQPDGVWLLDTDPGVAVVVPGTDLRVVLEPLTDEDYAALVQLAVVSLSEHDVPAAPRVDLAKPRPDAGGAYGPAAGGGSEGDGGEGPADLAAGPATGPGDVGGLALLHGLASLTDPGPVDGPAEAEPAGDGAPEEAGEADRPILPAPRPENSETPEGLLPPGQDEVPVEAPMVRVLGQPDITGARGSVESSRRRSLLETASWIALHPGADRRAMDEALWPGEREVDRRQRNPRISKLRTWLGRDDAGDLYLRRGLYEFTEAVRCDWHLFQDLVAAAGRTSGPDAEGLLQQALRLVRGRPFAGVDPRRYTWAEHITQDMVSAVVDAATELAEYHLRASSPRAALWAATKGLEVAEETERLHRIVLRAHHALGDREGLERAAMRLDGLLQAWDVDAEDATALLLEELLMQGRPATV